MPRQIFEMHEKKRASCQGEKGSFVPIFSIFSRSGKKAQRYHQAQFQSSEEHFDGFPGSIRDTSVSRDSGSG